MGGGGESTTPPFFISALDGGGQFQTLTNLLPGKQPAVPIVYENGWAPDTNIIISTMYSCPIPYFNFAPIP
jgi:hypothetical protein